MSQVGSHETEGGRYAVLFWLTAATLFAVGVVLRTETFTLTWTGVHNSWGGAFYGNVARNFLRYGAAATGMAPVVNSGIVEPDQFEFYYHHPPMVMWLTAFSFQLFGISEWSARLMPLIFSILTMGLVFEFARSAFGRGTALCALAFMAVLPVDAYYATHVDPNSSMSIFLTALAVEGYRRWLASGRDRDFAVSAVAIVLGCMTGWFTYLIVPGIVAHAWFVENARGRREVWVRLWLLPALAVGVFAMFVLHRKLALTGQPEVFDSLPDRFLKRTVNYGASRFDIYEQHLRHIWQLYTLPFVALSAAWVVTFVHDLRGGRLEAADWCIAILLSYGVLYGLAFPGHLPSHDFFVRTYGPGVALACGVTLTRLAGSVRPTALRASLLVIATTVAGVVATVRTQELYAIDARGNGPLLQGFGEVVAEVSSPRDPVFLPIDGDAVLQYYVDRPTTFDLATPDAMREATSALEGPYLILVPERAAADFPDLMGYLRTEYTELYERELHVFRRPAEADPGR